MGAAQIIRTEAGEELVVLGRRDYDALLARAGDEEAEDRMSTILLAEAQAQVAAGLDGHLPERVWAQIEAGDNPVRVIRQFRGMTQSQLAEGAGLRLSDVSALEDVGGCGAPGTLVAVARHLGIPADILAA